MIDGDRAVADLAARLMPSTRLAKLAAQQKKLDTWEKLTRNAPGTAHL
jgi:hypothetical protein